MKKLLIIVVGIISIPLLILGFSPIIFYMFNPQPHSNTEVNQLVHTYLENKYTGIQFRVTDIGYSIPLGEDHGRYTINVTDESDVSFTVRDNDSLSDPTDDYKESIWRNEAKKAHTPIVSNLFSEPFQLMVNIGTPAEIEKLPMNTPYSELVTTYKMEHYVYIYVEKSLDSSSMNQEYERQLKMFQHMESLGINNFSIDITYLDQLEGSGDPHYYFHLDTNSVMDQKDISEIESAIDMEKFGRFAKKI